MGPPGTVLAMGRGGVGEEERQRNRRTGLSPEGLRHAGRRPGIRQGGGGLRGTHGDRCNPPRPWHAHVASGKNVRGLPGPAPNPNHAVHPGRGQKPQPPARGGPRTGTQSRARIPVARPQRPPDRSRPGCSQRAGGRPKEGGHSGPAALPRTGGHRHSLSVMSPRPWAYSRSRSRVTSSFSSRISLLLGSSLMTALQRICLARSAYLDGQGNCGLCPCRASPRAPGALPGAEPRWGGPQ